MRIERFWKSTVPVLGAVLIWVGTSDARGQSGVAAATPVAPRVVKTTNPASALPIPVVPAAPPPTAPAALHIVPLPDASIDGAPAAQDDAAAVASSFIATVAHADEGSPLRVGQAVFIHGGRLYVMSNPNAYPMTDVNSDFKIYQDLKGYIPIKEEPTGGLEVSNIHSAAGGLPDELTIRGKDVKLENRVELESYRSQLELAQHKLSIEGEASAQRQVNLIATPTEVQFINTKRFADQVLSDH